MQIIKATTHPELKAIEALANTIWNEHYPPIIGKAQVDYMLDKFQSFRAMNEQIADGYEYYSFFDGYDLIGYLAIQPRDGHLFLSKVYVLKEQRGNGFGKRAIAFCEQRASELGFDTIQLTVNKYNNATIAAYERSGFKKMRPAVFDIGAGYIMDDFVMEKQV